MNTSFRMPGPCIGIGVTGHRASEPGFAVQRDAVAATMEAVLGQIDAVRIEQSASLGMPVSVRLHTLLAGGTDQLAADIGLAKGWELVAPLPLGRTLNAAINSETTDPDDARRLLDGGSAHDKESAAHHAAVIAWYSKTRLFELAERDAQIAELWLAALDQPGDASASRTYLAAISQRAAAAGQVLIEQSDLLVAVWNGSIRELPGGTGHTIASALAAGTPVVCIDPEAPDRWRVLDSPEALFSPDASRPPEEMLQLVIRAAIRPGEGGALLRGSESLERETWHSHSNPLWTQYRRIEALFGGDGRPLRSLRQNYESPDEIASGSAAEMLATAAALPGIEHDFLTRIEQASLRRFAWADGISTRLSDAYRGGMVANFILSALAIAAGIAYQPLASDDVKWVFALAEFCLLSAILLITWLGTTRRWHRRWFETRRVAEYLRHGPILALFGTARPPGRWPKGIQTSWPEYCARASLREIGLPSVAITPDYLRQALDRLLGRQVAEQARYHRAKAKRLRTVHHRLDRVSTALFFCAFVAVSSYLAIAALSAHAMVDPHWPHRLSKAFTYMGVIFPTFGAAIAGIRYFGDFERFAAISQVSAEKLELIDQRVRTLLANPDHEPEYATAIKLVHAMDDVVVDEIENWQAVFGGKHIAVPV